MEVGGQAWKWECEPHGEDACWPSISHSFQGPGGRSKGLSPHARAPAPPASFPNAASLLHVHRWAHLRRGRPQLSRYLAAPPRGARPCTPRVREHPTASPALWSLSCVRPLWPISILFNCSAVKACQVLRPLIRILELKRPLEILRPDPSPSQWELRPVNFHRAHSWFWPSRDWNVGPDS